MSRIKFVNDLNSYDNKRIKIIVLIADVMFFFTLALVLFTRHLEATLWPSTYEFAEKIRVQLRLFYDTHLVSVLIFCAVVKLIYNKSIVRGIFFVFIYLVGINIKNTHDTYQYILIAILFIIAASMIDAKKILVLYLVVDSFVLILTLAGAFSGKLDNIIELGRNREYLGFLWTTTPVMLFSYITFTLIVLKKGKINIKEYIVLNLINICFFIFTDTRFAFLIVFLTLFLVFFLNKQIEELFKFNISKYVAVLFPWLAFGFIYIITIMYNEKNLFFLKLNNILSNRLRQCKFAINKYGISLYGQNISWITTTRGIVEEPATYVDSAYLQFLLKFGWLFTVIILFMFSYLIYKAYNAKIYYLIVVLIFVLAFGLTEQQPFVLEYDMFLLFVFSNIEGLKDKTNHSLCCYRFNKKNLKYRLKGYELSL